MEAGSTESTGATEVSGPESDEKMSEEMTEEELLTYFAQFLPTASHKEEYSSPIIEALSALPEEKPESALRQKDIDCDTLQWFNATYAMFTASRSMDYHLIDGFNDENDDDRPYLLASLESSWGITDRQSALDTLYWLVSSGHAQGFQADIQAMALYGWLELSEEEMRQSILDLADGETLAEEDVAVLADYFIQEREVYETCGENGIDAWDYCRFMQIAGDSYYAGFLALEEMLTLQLEGSLAIQQQFHSWEEMNQSYLQGYTFWVQDSYGATKRRWAYEGLLKAEDCPWKVLDFNMTLERFW